MKGHFNDDSLGTTLAIEIMGNIEYVDKNIRVDDNKSHKIRDMTLQRKGTAHMIVYYVGEPVENFGGTTYGLAGCIGCVCRPDWRTITRLDWIPRGSDPDFKHCILAKTKFENRQGKVRK